MRAVIGILAAALISFAAPTLAHGENKHEEKSSTTEVAEVDSRQSVRATAQAEPVVQAEPAPQRNVMSLARNLHPATVHFPIALLLVAVLVEALAAMRSSQPLHNAARVMAIAGGFGAVLAALFGWIHTGMWMGGGNTVQAHRWIGTALGLLGFVIAWLGWKKPGAIKLFRLVLLLCATAVLAQGFLGGELGHGAGHLWK